MASSSSLSSLSSSTNLPLLLILTLEDRKMYTNNIPAYEYWVYNQGPGYNSATPYSFVVVVHHLLLDVHIQHTVTINHQDDNHDVHVLYYNNTRSLSISDVFIDGNGTNTSNDTDGNSIGSTLYITEV